MIGSQPTVGSAARELQGPSPEGARSSRLRVWCERGQAAVEFAMVVPLLCLIIIAILHFGTVMNYWLDLNHVASEAARKVAVKSYSSYGEYRTFACNRLETNELRTGGTSSIPTAATIAISYPETTSQVGDPVKVVVSAGYSLPFIGTTVTLRGSATMRLEQPANVAGSGACA